MYEITETDLLMKHITEKLDSLLNKHLKPYELTGSQVRILHYLKEIPQPVSQKELELHFKVSHPTIVGLLKRLEQKGFVRTEFELANKKRKNVYTTEKCNKLLEEGDVYHERMYKTLLAGLSNEQIKSLNDMLNKIHNNIKDL
ncbi:MAG: MarR family winged helix-turn-helix transcriptional regulator [Hominilimicola sp.]